MFQALFENISDCAVLVGKDGVIKDMNASARLLLGYSFSDAYQSAKTVFPEYEAVSKGGQFATKKDSCVSGFSPTFVVKSTGNRIKVETKAFRSSGYGEENGTTLVLFRTAGADAETKSLINQMAYYDALTNIPNRSLFQDRLRTAIAHAKRNGRMVALHIVDVDNFKLINETMGMKAGDELLKAISARIKENIRESDTVARLGNDEFAVIQTDIREIRQITILARRLIEKLSKVYHLNGQRSHVGANIGISIFPMDGSDIETLLKESEMALSKSKQEGRNSYKFFSSDMDEIVQARVALERDLRSAIEEREFRLVYQPRVCLKTGRVVGAEALIRWDNRERGVVSPVEFIPVAEETGLIIDIGEWVIDEACRQIAQWRDRGLTGIRVSVNLSAIQFRKENMLASIKRAIRESGIDPSHLGIEITESALIENTSAAAAMLRGLDGLGIEVSVDDFGTGYSSLSYLKRFRVHALKIDRSFVMDVCTDPDDAAIANAVIGLGRSLGLKVVAEGVETPEQMQQLRGYGCDEMQGFLVSKPIEPDEFIERFRSVSDVFKDLESSNK